MNCRLYSTILLCAIVMSSSLLVGCPEDILAAVTPKISVSTKTLDYGGEDTELTFTLSNRGGGQLLWTASESSSWIKDITPDSGLNGAVVHVTIDRNKLDPGLNSTTIVITSAAGSRTIRVHAQDLNNYDLSSYWPFEIGNTWTWSLAGAPTDQQTLTIADNFFTDSGFEVWQMQKDETKGTDKTSETSYYFYLNGVMFKTTNRDAVDALPEISDSFRAIYEEDLTPGTYARDYISGDITLLKKGSLSSFMPIMQDNRIVLMDDFNIGDPQDCIAACIDVAVFGEDLVPLRIFSRGIGLILDSERTLYSATVGGVTFDNSTVLDELPSNVTD